MVAGVATTLLFALGLGGSTVRDTVSAPVIPTDLAPRMESLRVGADRPEMFADGDTVRVRRRAVRLSEGYYTRAKLHKVSSLLMIPSAAYMYASGQQLFQKGRNAPGWATNGHGIGAGVVAGLFAVNTATGAMNWWETRHQQSGFLWRTTHAALMLASDAGFFTVGQLATPAENSIDKRKLHKNLAIASISMATVSYVMMLKPLRRD
jgi:hypothetical protein